MISRIKQIKLSDVQKLLVTGIITAILAFPPFLVIYHYVPAMRVAGIRVDHFLIYFILFALLFFVVKKYRTIFYGIFLTGLVVITITTLAGGYSIQKLYQDYKTLLYNIQTGSVQFKFNKKNNKFANEDRLRNAIDYQSSEVRSFAVNIAVMHFEDYANSEQRISIQAFSVFKEIRRRWMYVHDPAFEDYYAKASESVQVMQYDNRFKGDCDDYSILMAACIKSIGGQVRIVRTVIQNDDGTETGHMYPEVKIGDIKDLERLSYLIKEELFPLESKNKDLFYHMDTDGSVWLNFDYNDHYPGGKYQSTIRESEIEI
jgi:hypothetical protein